MPSPFPRSKSPNIGHPSKVTMEDHGFMSNDSDGGSMGTRWGRKSSSMGTYGPPDTDQDKKRKRAEKIAKSFCGITFNFGGKGKKDGKGDTKNITTDNNIRSGGGQRYTKPDTLFT